MADVPIPARRTRFALPNLMTFARILTVPAIVAVFWGLDGPEKYWIAFGLFMAASITDYLDGYLARAWKLQSRLGKMLDPIADKLLVGISVLMLVFDGTVSGFAIWAAAIILFREITVSGLREFLAELNVKLHVTTLSKWKTGAQMAAIATLFLGPAITHTVAGVGLTEVGLGLLWISAMLTLITGLDYLSAALRHIDED